MSYKKKCEEYSILSDEYNKIENQSKNYIKSEACAENLKSENETLKAAAVENEIILNRSKEVVVKLNKEIGIIKEKHKAEIASLKKDHRLEVKSWKKGYGKINNENLKLKKKIDSVAIPSTKITVSTNTNSLDLPIVPSNFSTNIFSNNTTTKIQETKIVSDLKAKNREPVNIPSASEKSTLQSCMNPAIETKTGLRQS